MGTKAQDSILNIPFSATTQIKSLWGPIASVCGGLAMLATVRADLGTSSVDHYPCLVCQLGIGAHLREMRIIYFTTLT